VAESARGSACGTFRPSHFLGPPSGYGGYEDRCSPRRALPAKENWSLGSNMAGEGVSR
jgi:hypothetical protein